MAKYIKCCCCNKRINLGTNVYVHTDKNGYDIYCSSDCLIESHGFVEVLDPRLAIEACCTIYETDAIKAQIRSLEASIEHSQRELDRLRKEIEQDEYEV